MSRGVGGWVGEVWVVYEAYEVKRKGKKYAVFYFAGKRFFYICDVITSPGKEKKRWYLLLLERQSQHGKGEMEKIVLEREPFHFARKVVA